jgi:hypothetical protein
MAIQSIDITLHQLDNIIVPVYINLVECSPYRGIIVAE